jgi:hypothetical protein
MAKRRALNTVDEEEKAFDLRDVLKAAEVKKTKKSKKSGTPVIEVDAATRKIAARYINAKEQEESAKAEREIAEADLTPKVESKWMDLCKSAYTPSVKLFDTEGRPVYVTWGHKYTAIEDVEAVKQELGIQQYNRLFTEKIEVKVKDVDDDVLTEIAKAVGAERFSALFEVTRTVQPKPEYTENFAKFDVKKRETLKQLVKPFKPAVKKG